MRTLEQGLKALQQIDLTRVKRKLQLPAPEGENWTAEQAELGEKWYRRYLELCLRYPELQAVPNGPIDTMWHKHILDTRAYAADCQAVFGVFLHHYPYFGLDGDATLRDNCFDETNALYRQHFGEDCTVMHQSFDHVGRGECEKDGSQCKHISAAVGMGCNSAGSGTGCGQGCKR